MRPFIGITASHQNDFNAYYSPKNYSNAIIEAGGLPVILPITSEEEIIEHYLAKIHGFLLAGGGDPDPQLFDEEPHPGLGEIDPYRDSFEIALIKKALEERKAILGICRGCQILNVAAGGTMIQSLEGQKEDIIKHRQDAPFHYPTHTVKLVEDTILRQIFGTTELRVNSSHHQAIKDVSPDFIISARSEDEVIEAIEKKKGEFAVGVQWHPEAMFEKNRVFLKIFEKFVKEVAK
ncbi:MAG: gamma-glutamyl-gamma-aminobutyrate hydrolase family protein [Candidatus Korarchaeota archaeon]|nr:gamma-glutamyl-gamma-aminobutyrate hydrolase family protein [Candidatus Korarchaeota archaeon]NIU85032.1 gamma-glutamyl-gamma-aminobutyrate hydrolase family protein [Candidatus Thorarchaeota archaeon]NIW15057.1 gamma-glutamyl-gamma-aminobutyrate hydrolase family protein [Candidatus Thorarchaeota archaeon]NIW53067.1 gamma-glutamyl-gamma-aminobutyrate hydrolase family protein [Candidatus Korarchaeota archaeon]